MQAIIASIIVHHLEALPLAYPAPREADMALFERARILLEADGDQG